MVQRFSKICHFNQKHIVLYVIDLILNCLRAFSIITKYIDRHIVLAIEQIRGKFAYYRKIVVNLIKIPTGLWIIPQYFQYSYQFDGFPKSTQSYLIYKYLLELTLN